MAKKAIPWTFATKLLLVDMVLLVKMTHFRGFESPLSSPRYRFPVDCRCGHTWLGCPSAWTALLPTLWLFRHALSLWDFPSTSCSSFLYTVWTLRWFRDPVILLRNSTCTPYPLRPRPLSQMSSRRSISSIVLSSEEDLWRQWRVESLVQRRWPSCQAHKRSPVMNSTQIAE